MTTGRVRMGPGPLDGQCERLLRELDAEIVVVIAGGSERFGEGGAGFSVNARGPGRATTCLQLRRMIAALEDTAKQLRAFELGLRVDG